ncbi:KTSC domain-containing protein [Sutcliffiella horikoshii]|uniref:KTSC domain-containing protein n=1 Tax=Sutcliffiella horikoshii TaxID=79883 RepID=UPI003CF7126D
MNFVSVVSDNLRAVAYDSSSQTLRIKFKNGMYDYFGVPENIHQGLMNASSHGEYHAKYIKNVYSYRKV